MMASTLSTTLIASKMFKPCSGFAKKVGSLPKKSGGKMSKHHESLAEFLWEVGDAGGYLVIPLGTYEIHSTLFLGNLGIMSPSNFTKGVTSRALDDQIDQLAGGEDVVS
jgi:hypothetical protein